MLAVEDVETGTVLLRLGESSGFVVGIVGDSGLTTAERCRLGIEFTEGIVGLAVGVAQRIGLGDAFTAVVVGIAGFTVDGVVGKSTTIQLDQRLVLTKPTQVRK